MGNTLLSASDTSVREILNLRPHPGGLLRPVGAPTLLPLAQHTPIGAITVGGSRRLVCARGSSLFTHPADSPTGIPTPATGSLPAAADCAVALSDSRLLVMSAGGSAEATAVDGQVTITTPPDFKGVSLTAQDYGPLSETVEGISMSDKESDLNLRLAAVESKLIALGKAAHAQLHLRAANDGRYSCAVVCGYRLRNHQGREIFRSQPFLLGSTEGLSAIELYSPDLIAIQSWQQTVNTWKIHLRVDASDELRAHVGSLEVVAMPQLHIIDPTQGGYAVLTRRTSSALPFARLRLAEGVGNSYARSRISSLAARLFDSGSVIYALSDPFSRNSDLDLNGHALPSFSADSAALRTALTSKIPAAPTTLEATFALPHSFTATCGCRSGDTILWGNISPVAYKGYSPAMMAAEFGDAQAWSFSMLTIFTDGRKVFSSGSSTSPIPKSLNALISYPHPEASKLRLRISWSGGAWRGDFQLTPSACGRFAYFLSADHAPIEVEANGGAAILYTPSASPSLSHLVVATHISAPLVAVDCIEMPDGPVRAIIERPGNDTAWDHTRSRFFIGTRGSVHALGVYINSSNPSHTLRRLSPMGIRSRGALTSISEGAAALLDTPQGALPVIINKNGAVAPLCKAFEASRICFNPITRELLVHGNGTTRVFCADYGWKWYHRSDISIQDAVQIDGLPYAVNDSGVYALANEKPYANTLPVHIEMDEHIAGAKLKCAKAVRLTASGADITVGLDIDRIEPDGSLKEPILRCGMSGILRRNPSLPIVSRPLRALRWKFAGEVDSSFIFKSLIFSFDEY